MLVISWKPMGPNLYRYMRSTTHSTKHKSLKTVRTKPIAIGSWEFRSETFIARNNGMLDPPHMQVVGHSRAPKFLELQKNLLPLHLYKTLHSSILPHSHLMFYDDAPGNRKRSDYEWYNNASEPGCFFGGRTTLIIMGFKTQRKQRIRTSYRSLRFSHYGVGIPGGLTGIYSFLRIWTFVLRLQLCNVLLYNQCWTRYTILSGKRQPPDIWGHICWGFNNLGTRRLIDFEQRQRIVG